MRIFLQAFFGKLAAAIFIAVCIIVGVGPPEWAKMITGIETGVAVRTGFTVLALITLAALLGPFISRIKFGRGKKARKGKEEKLFASTPIIWEQNYFLMAARTEWGVEFYGFQLTGRNNTDKFIGKLGGSVRSEKNGREFAIKLQHNNELVSPDGYGLPARNQFHIGVEFMPRGSGLPGAKFLAKYGILTFSFGYDDQRFSRAYSYEETSAEVERIEGDLRPKPIKSEAGFRAPS